MFPNKSTTTLFHRRLPFARNREFLWKIVMILSAGDCTKIAKSVPVLSGLTQVSRCILDSSYGLAGLSIFCNYSTMN
jgi:hypothetical protein